MSASFDKKTAYLSRRTVVILAGLLLTVSVAYVDYEAPASYAIQILYFIPVLLVTWFAEPAAGFLTALMGMAVWVVIDDEFRHRGANPDLLRWNYVRAALFLALSLVLCLIKRQLDIERKNALQDPVTGLANRRAFFRGARREIDRAGRTHNPMALAFIDVDDFKSFNDTHGHEMGDELLSLLGHVLHAETRSIDIAARFGGDEFVVLLPDTNSSSAREIVGRTHELLAVAARERGWDVTCSIGVAVFNRPPASVDDMLREADRHMYRAKKGGKNTAEYAVIGQP